MDVRGGRGSATTVVVLCLAVAAGPTAAAAEMPDTAESASAPASTPAPPTTARDWFLTGKARHERGEYGAAATAYAEAYRLSPHPAHLYNIALVLRLKGDHREALRYYRLFLAADTKGTSWRGEAEARVKELSALLGEPADLPPPRASGAPSAPLLPSDPGGTVATARAAAVSSPKTDPTKERRGAVGAAWFVAGLGVGAALVGGAAAALAVLLRERGDATDRYIDALRGVPVLDQR